MLKVFTHLASDLIEKIKSQTKITEEFVHSIQKDIMSASPELIKVLHSAVLDPSISKDFYKLYREDYKTNLQYKTILLNNMCGSNTKYIESGFMPYFYDCGCLASFPVSDETKIGEGGIVLKRGKYTSHPDIEGICPVCLKEYEKDCDSLNSIANTRAIVESKKEARKKYITPEKINLYRELNEALCLLYAGMEIPVETMPLLLNINPTVDLLLKNAQYS